MSFSLKTNYILVWPFLLSIGSVIDCAVICKFFVSNQHKKTKLQKNCDKDRALI